MAPTPPIASAIPAFPITLITFRADRLRMPSISEFHSCIYILKNCAKFLKRNGPLLYRCQAPTSLRWKTVKLGLSQPLQPTSVLIVTQVTSCWYRTLELYYQAPAPLDLPSTPTLWGEDQALQPWLVAHHTASEEAEARSGNYYLTAVEGSQGS